MQLCLNRLAIMYYVENQGQGTYETKNMDTPSDPKLSNIGLAGNLENPTISLPQPATNTRNVHNHPITNPIQHIQQTSQDCRRQQLDGFDKHLLSDIAPCRFAK